MKKSVRSVLTKVGFAALVLSLNFFAACEIGLGSSVDVEAPKISFSDTTIDSGAVVRDTFAVFGKWEDDGSISSLNATLKNLTTGAEIKKAGTIADNSWNVTFSPADDAIADGSYELSIIIKDGANHESKISRAFVIDNTPPLVVLSRPSTKNGASSFDSYGQKFTLEGKAADDNDVSLIEVNVYADAACTGEPLKTISLPSVPLTIETDVAEYSKTEANDYSVIYGIVDDNGIAKRDGGTVARYCKLVVYDGAQRYPADGSAQTEADKKGNSIDYYYLNSDLAELFTEGYKITELYHILNGTYTESNARTTSPDGVVTLLKSDTTKVTTGQFKLNPENSPHFVVSARSILEAGHTIDEAPLTNGNSKLEVEIAPGLDGHLIKEETIGIYLVRCDNYGNPLKEDGSVAADESEAKIIWLVETDKHEQQAEITQSGSTYKFKTKTEVGNANYPDLMIGENYYVAVVGKDMQGNNILCDGIYGFQLITSGLNIEVGIRSEPDWISTNANANDVNKTPKIILTYSTENKPFEILRGLDAANLVSIDTGVMTSPYQDNLNITSTGPLGFEPTIVVYKVNGENSAESNPKSIELRYDDTAPQVTISEKPDEIATEQKSITFRGTAADKNSNGEEESGVKTVYIQILDKATPTNATPVAGSLNAIKASVSGGEWLCQIKPEDYAAAGSAFTTEGPKIIKVTAVDGVGLTSQVSDEFMFDTAKPKITLKKYNLYGEFNDASKAKNVDSTIVVGKTFRINGTLVEKYGLDASAGFKIKQEWKDFAETSTSEKTIDMPAADASGNWAITLPFNGTDGSAYDNDTIVNNHSADGIYTYTITAKDKAGKTDNDGITFTAKLKTDGPLLEISSPEFDSSNVTKYWQKNRDIMFSGKASSPATVSAIYWTQDESKTTDSWTGWEKAEGTDYWNFTVSVAADGDNHKVFIAAVDSLGNKTLKLEYTIKVDSTGPEVAPKFYQIGSDVIQAVNGSSIYVSGINPQKLTVYGKYNETVSGPYVPKTGDTLKPLAFQIDGADKTPTIKYSNTDISSLTADALSTDAVKNSFSATSPSLATNSWKAEFTTSDIAAGSFAVTARNGANVPKENTDLSIVIDSKKPEFGNSISITKSSYDRTEDQSDNNSENDVLYYYVNNRDKTTISGTASDANLLSVKIEAASTGKTTINKSETSNPYNWSFELDMTGWTSDTDVTLTVTDKAGNTATKLLKLVFDTTPPLAKHEWDKKDKDLIFRIGEANNELDELKAWSPSVTALDNTDKNVGGKYKRGTYGNSETIRIRGSFEDSGSGVDTVYYKTFSGIPSKTQINNFIADPENEKTGNAIKPKTDTKRVSYTDNDTGARKFKNVETTFTEIVSDLTANTTNYIVILAVDKVGNVGLDYAEKDNSTDKEIEASYYTLNIDTIAPENTVDSNVDTNSYVNPAKTSEIEISGVANSGKNDDGTALVKASDVYVELKVNGKRILIEDEENDDYNANKVNGKIVLDTSSTGYSKTNIHWTATIKSSVVFDGVNAGAYPVYATIYDGAGNKQNPTVATINIDKTDPTIKINTITDADKDTSDKLDVNGEFIISGTASDTEKLSSVTVKYKKSGDENWTSLTQESDSTPSNWKVKLTTTDTTKFEDNASYDIEVTATDAAGNTKKETKEIFVNQNSDRPVIKITNLDRLGAGTTDDPYYYILKYGTNARIEGSVSDDDADSNKVVTTFKASTSPISSATADSAGSLVTYTAASGDFVFQPSNIADGEKTIYFYVKDNKGKEYYSTYSTGSNPQLNRPYQLYKTDAKVKNIETLTYKSDKTPPESSVSLNAYNSDTPEMETVTKDDGTTEDKDKTMTTNNTSLGSNCVAGGTAKKYIDLSVTAKDNNGIKGVVIILEQEGKSTKYYRSNDKVEEEGITSYETTGSVDSITTNAEYKYVTDRIDINDYEEGQVKVTVKAYDQSGLYSNQQSLFMVDKTGPAFELSASTKDGDIVYGIQSNTVGGNVSDIDVEKIYYAISLDGNAPDAIAGDSDDDYEVDNENNRNLKNNILNKWNPVRNAGTSATLVLYDGNTTVENAFICQSLREWLRKIQNKTIDELNEDDTRVDMYIHFMAVDECGNKGTPVARKLSVYPNGDKPVIELVYPENKTDGTEPSLSGTIRVYGYASAAIGRVEATYLQIDPDYNGTWKTTEAENDTTDNTWRKALKTAITGTKANYPIEKIGTHNLYGIKAEGTGNWNLPINGYNEFDPDSGTKTIAIRIYALSESGKVSEPYTQLIKIDPNAPHIGASDDDVDESNTTTFGNRKYRLQIVDFNTNKVGDFTEFKETKAYKAEMWIKGQKYLIASVYDDSGIKTITLNEKIQGIEKKELVVDGVAKTDAVIESNVTGQDKTIRITQVTCGHSGKKNFNICIPLPTGAGSGSLEWELEAVEDSTNNNRCKETIIINYDNTAPKLGTSDHEKYGIEADIHQSNGFYTLKGWSTDADGDNNVSGMMGVAFYFMRRGSSSTRVYDPMYKDNYAAGKHNYVDVTGANPSGITYSNGLFWKHQTGITVTSSSKLESVLTVTADDNIHIGGLALIGGTIYRISYVSGTTVKVEGQVSLAETTADFALALVVDNLTKKEKTDSRTKNADPTAYGYGYYGSHDTADDGDLMVEDWDGTSTEGQWTAIINSANIPDGPIELHYVAFDKSQNYAVGIVGNVTDTATTGTGNDYWDFNTLDVTANAVLNAMTDTSVSSNLATNFYYAFDTPAYVSNNAPRIAGVTVGCDYDGSGTITDVEKRSRYVGEANRYIGGEDTIVRKATGVSKNFNASSDGTDAGNVLMAIKDDMEVELEIIGGNGRLYYQYKRDSGSYTQSNAMVAGTDYTRNTSEGETTDFVGQVYYNTTKLKKLEFTEAQLKDWYTTNTDKSWWTIEVWDSTEETTQFTTSQNATLKLPLSIQVNDTLAPNTVVSPLYWKSATDNSVYRDANETLFGHIELIKDLETTAGKLGNNSLYGSNDDKISGIVVFKGYAYDNKRLSKLMWGIVDHKADNAYTSPTYLFPATNSALQAGATFTGGVWSSKPAQTDAEQEALDSLLTTNHYTFVVSDSEEDGAYLDSKGHKVAWTLTVDTSYIKNVVEKDARLYVYAEDEAGGKTTITNTAVTSTSTDQETYDLQTKIPTYQVDILPYITSVTTRLAAKDVVSRTALGHYPIASDENSIILNGYNLAQNNTSVTLNATSRSSGAYEYPVGNTGISTINNINNNSAHGDYNVDKSGLAQKTKVTNMYNRQPDTNTNLNLTDDVYFDVWEINADAATSGYPALKYPVMHINPSNNQIGFGFVRGTDSVSFPANGNSYTWYQRNNKDYVSTNFVYDTKGVAHTISIGLDAQLSSGVAGRMNYNNSTWYNTTNEGQNSVRQWDKAYNVALESIGIPNDVYVKGVKTDVANAQGNIDIERFSTPSMAVATHGNNSAVYIIYYDTNHDQIRFRYGLVTNNGTERGDTQFGLLNDSKCERERCTSYGSDNINGVDYRDSQLIPTESATNGAGNGYGSHGMFEADREFYSLVTGKYYKQIHDTDANEGIDNNIDAGTEVYDTKNNGSEIHAIGVIPSADGMNDDKVVMVWYDKTVSRLKYIYRTNLGTSNDDALDRSKAKRDADNDGVSAGDKVYWSAPKDLFGTNNIPVSKIALTVDKNGGIHIAAYDQTNADLVYAYLPSYNHLDEANNKAYVCRVDAYSQIGTDLTIDTAIVDNKVVPYISYYAEGLAALPKVAYLVNGIDTTSATTIANSVVDGADKSTKLFTGKWEVTLIPTTALLQRYDVNIGLFKDADGALTRPAKTNDTATSKDERKRYANGTTNLVVGYATKKNGTGYIETAMRKGVPDKVQH